MINNINNISFVKNSIRIFMTSVLLVICLASNADQKVQVQYYFDDRDFNTFELLLSANNLPAGFSFWGFTDFHSDQHDSSERYDLTRSFSEYRFSNNKVGTWTGIDNLELQAEVNDTSPDSNIVWRGGITYKWILPEKNWLQFRLFPLQSNKHNQVSMSYFYSFTPDFKFSGFADYNIQSGGDDQWVIEPRFNYRVMDKTWLLLEYRYSGFEKDNATLDGTGWAIGISYDLL